MIGNNHENNLDTQEHSRVTVSIDTIDVWTDAREWSLRPVWELRVASGQIWWIRFKQKRIRQPQPRLNIERSLVYR